MFRKVLIANRGVIACRIIRTLQRMGIATVAVYSEADAHALHVAQADEAVLLGPAAPAQSYLDTLKILEAAFETGAEAIHPGYGFLSENAEFAAACEDAGIAFIGPSPEQLRLFGLKHTARELAARCGVPLVPGTDLLKDADEAVAAAGRIGYPVMLKSTAGGGGIGMRLCWNQSELEESFAIVQRLGAANFHSSGVFLEKYIEHARHIEVQLFGDGEGTVIELGERDCSVQRRNQKVIEETPAPAISDATRRQLLDTAVKLGEAVSYQSAGTVEYIYDAAAEQFYFLEVNTRLQVEHGVTEEVTGVDLVEWMVRLAARELGDLKALKPVNKGSSIQVRVYAEDPAKNYQPSAGVLTYVAFPAKARVETWVESGSVVTANYDPLLAKVIVSGADRAQAVARLAEALEETALYGLESNLAHLRQVVADPRFQQGGVTTRVLETLTFRSNAVEIVEPGTMTTVQDYPGRLGYWAVGVPPSGPMDALAFRLGNRSVGNADGAPGLECTLSGPSVVFRSAAVVALTGAAMEARLNGAPVPYWSPVNVPAGATLELGAIQGAGARTYLSIQGGLDVARYLDSAATFTLGRFGGHAGRALRAGDVVHIGNGVATSPAAPAAVPAYSNTWNIGVLYGPHGAPDFFTDEDIETFFESEWVVHYNSSRTGVRLIGPKPVWARKDGGEAGLHPSNIHDNAYAIGTVDFTGDMPVILGPDGPSLGGFVCPATIVTAELWKMGQLKAGDTVHFVALTAADAARMERELEESIASLSSPLAQLPAGSTREPAILAAKPAKGGQPAMVSRASGDKYLLIEYGDAELNLNLRFRAHALMQWLEANPCPGIIDLTPGIRSLQIHYESRTLPREELLRLLDDADRRLPGLDALTVPSRIVHLPLSWDDPATRLAIDKYMRGVRPDAPWCPSNIEFIRRINGLSSVEEVCDIVFGASYLVLGLGDVYLGAPVATPIDPRHRLVTTKYNPARTWTPENAVGIGGAYMCVYGMEGPGGYQLVGRTVQMWNTYKSTPDFAPGSPWLLRFFDQIQFYPVSAGELLDLRERFTQGKFELRVDEDQFSLPAYDTFLNSIGKQTEAFRKTQQAAFVEERERWAAARLDAPIEEAAAEEPVGELAIPEGHSAVRSPATASVWRWEVTPGQRVEAGQRLLILEAMKMEIAVASPKAGVVARVLCEAGSQVSAGQSLLFLKSS
ncbi:MAG: urea carboxylase [Bryobacteraceae bacterium]